MEQRQSSISWKVTVFYAITSCFFGGLMQELVAQNLLLNGSFEKLISQTTSERREGLVYLDHADGWHCPSDLVTVYNDGFASKRFEKGNKYTPIGYAGKKFHGVPYNLGGYQYPRTGQSYAGLSIVGGYGNNIVTHAYGLSGKVDNPIQLEISDYYCEFYISVNHRNSHIRNGISTIGVFLTSQKKLKDEGVRSDAFINYQLNL